MKTRMKIWCLVGTLCGAFIGTTIGALSRDSGTAILLSTGAGLISGLGVGALLGLISPHRWAEIRELFDLVGSILECCSIFGVFFLGFSAIITSFIFGHHLWLSVLAGTSVMGLLIFVLSLAVFLDRTRMRSSLKRTISH